MRVIQINACYSWGSTGTIVTDIQSACKAVGIDCEIAYAMPCHSSVYNGYKISCLLSRKIHALLSKITGKQAYYSSLSTLRLIYHIFKYSPDIVHLHNVHNNYLNLNLLLLYLAKKKIPVVLTLHDCWFHTGGCFHYTAIGCYNWLHGCGHCPHKQTELLYPFNDNTKGILSDRIRFFGAIQKLTIVGVSNWIVQQAKLNVFKDRPSMVIYNGVNMDLFRPSESNFRAKMGWGDKQIILCPANKWQDAINRQTFLYFLEHINSQQIIVLFGARKKYRTHHPQLYYIDYINDKRELAKLYSCADVMVNCTREESLSFINIEAQSCGTPVVTYDGTGVVETVDGLCGFAVPTGDYVQLFARTMQILTNKPLAKECRKWVADHFDKDKNYKLYVNCYRKILRQ